MEDDEIYFSFVKRLGDTTPIEKEEPKYKLPKKGSKYAAGYDFYNPEEVIIEPHQIKYVKTGVKAKFPKDKALLLLNRSSNPKKKNLVIANGVGLIDADYYNNDDNEGEIAFAFMNISNEPIIIKKDEKLGQGMFIKYYNVSNFIEEESEERKGRIWKY